MRTRKRARRRRIHRPYVSVLATILSLVGLAANAEERQDAPADEEYYEQISRVVIRLEDPASGAPRGTAFFSQHTRDNEHYYLITARHVVDPRKDLRARVPSQQEASGRTEVVELRIPADAWIFHPLGRRRTTHGSAPERLYPVDIAVAKVPGIRGRRVRTVGYCPDPCPEGRDHQFLTSDPRPPASVLVWGFPESLGFKLETQRPLARLGIVAMVADEPFIRTGGVLRDDRVLLIDAPIFPGNSGGPVFLSLPDGEATDLAGMISASNASRNYAVAEPASRVAEAMEHALVSQPKARASWRPLERP